MYSYTQHLFLSPHPPASSLLLGPDSVGSEVALPIQHIPRTVCVFSFPDMLGFPWDGVYWHRVKEARMAT